MAPIIQKLLARRELIILALMLELLHFSIWIDFGSPQSRSFMLMHLGLFLIWQPVWRNDEQISWQNSLAFIVLTLIFVTFMTWWLMFAWLILLCGFAGGRIIIHHQERNTYMLVLLFLTSELIIECTSKLFHVPVINNIREVFRLALPLLPLIITVLPLRNENTRMMSVDILHALTTSTLISVLIFGSLLNMYLSGTDYLISLVQALLAIALFLFAISWLLSPRTGFSGLSQLWTRSMLNIGTPLEQWLTQLSNLSQQQHEPEAFLQTAMEDLVALPWISGVEWHTQSSTGTCGQLTKLEVAFKTDALTVHVYSHHVAGGALYLHCNLLVQLIENFYVAKIRERILTQQTHLQAIHETGARVTHDIKNLLQSLHAITSVLEQEDNDSNSKMASQQLFARQLPYLTQRLQLALDKLQTPDKTSGKSVCLKDWWQNLKSRTNQTNIEFHSDITADAMISAELFDSVTENLLENLREKNKLERDLSVDVFINSDAHNTQLLVRDNGSKIPERKAETILKEPVKSDNGLGVGLFQAARLADSMGYVLTLKSNQQGNVCFELSNNPDTTIQETSNPAIST